LTQTPGASFSLTFNGTAVWVFGAKRFNHGLYSVSVDSGPVHTFNGFDNTGLFQFPLFNGTGLVAGIHTINVTNAATGASAPFLDVDFVSIY
jgi:hypothetical protein